MGPIQWSLPHVTFLFSKVKSGLHKMKYDTHKTDLEDKITRCDMNKDHLSTRGSAINSEARMKPGDM